MRERKKERKREREKERERERENEREREKVKSQAIEGVTILRETKNSECESRVCSSTTKRR